MKNSVFYTVVISTCLICFIAVSPSLAEPIELDESLSKLPIGKMIEYLVDPEGALTITDIQDARHAGSWKISEKDGPSFSFTSDVYWLRFTIANKAARELEFFLEQEYPLIDNIKLYTPDGRGFRETEVGRMKPFKERPYQYRTFIFPLTAPGGAQATYYLRYQSTSSMNLVPIIWSPEYFRHRQIQESHLLLLFNGILFIMILYNMLLFFVIRWLEYLYYPVVLFLYLLFMATINGTAFQYLWPESPVWGSFCMPIILCLLMIFVSLFCIELVGLRVERKRARYIKVQYHFALISICVLSVLLVSCFFIPYRYAMQSSTIMAGVTFTTIWIQGATLIYKEKNRQAILGIPCALPVFGGALAYVLKTLSVLPNNFITEWSVHIGILFMAVLFSIVLADKVNVIRRELAVLNVTLEEKVVERTEQLESMNESLFIINDQLTDARRIAQMDMDMAAQVQRTLLAAEPPRVEGWDVAVKLKPMAQVSGDLYDFYATGGSLEGIALFDVSGHGIASGLITMIARSVFHRNFTRGRKLPLARVLQNANRDLINEIGKVDNYLTGILLRFDSGTVEYVNAGHSDLLLKKGDSHKVGIVNIKDHDIKGMFLGAEGVDLPYEDISFNTSTGDVLLLYTDALYESRNQQGEEFGIESLRASLKNAPAGSARNILDSIASDLFSFVGSSELQDDLTIIVVKRTA
ncbi:MAG: SpoIIE family protein phosphatase [Spirochaetes bacterium]|nr:SpoIIE family protein phosphatase [Spirochaetota bacterium]